MNEIDADTWAELVALADAVKALRTRALTLADRLPPARSGDDAEAPEEGAALLRTRLLCIIRDTLEPAHRDLLTLADEHAPG
jgi:hypothetical protein